jgi:mannose-6-phosphate isomerase-like protein (cupin superfamily)
MSKFCIDVSKVQPKKKDWGSLKSLFDGSSVGAAGGFILSSIIYERPHYSGIHEDHEVIYILEGKGSALIGTEEIDFQKGFLLIIPAGIEHSINRVAEGPVKAILAHFK